MTADERKEAKRLSSARHYASHREKRREESRLRMKARYDAGHRWNPETLRRAQLKYRYGITESQWQEMYDAQGGACGVCRRPSDDLCIDHDHATGIVRGLLCRECNWRVGLIEAIERGEYQAFRDWMAKDGIVASNNYDRRRRRAVPGRPRLSREG